MIRFMNAPDGRNVVLIGMPGVGKSTVGVLTAKALAMKFVDTDLVIQDQEGRALREILNDEGLEGFRRIEERALLSLNAGNAVVATGGSAVYSESAMAHLRRDGIVVWLDAPLEELKTRLSNLPRRGVVMQRGQSWRDCSRSVGLCIDSMPTSLLTARAWTTKPLWLV